MERDHDKGLTPKEAVVKAPEVPAAPDPELAADTVQWIMSLNPKDPKYFLQPNALARNY